MTTETQPQEFTFQAEIKQLLHLLSHSLYQNKEIAIRELISNASDAIDKYRHLTLTNADLSSDDELGIVIEPNEEDRILSIRDNGIGMTQDELVQNLGTIAHSGSLDFLKTVSGDAKSDLSLIGQFGVGFYSAFMLADTVEVLTRSHQEETGWRWQSDGSGSFTIEAAEDLPRGTEVRLHLKSDMDEYTKIPRLKHILTQYSTFVPHPLKLADERVNEQRPIWVEPKNQLDDEQYNSFYQYLTHHSDEKPLWHIHLSADTPFQFHAILYCPPSNFELMGFSRAEHGLHLCAKRILVQNDNRDLLPEYLRFLHGLVDSEDLPLNVSRQALQDDSVFRKMRKVLVKRVLSHLQKMADDTPEDYLTFYRQFGSALREGLQSDFENREAITKLLRFQTSHGDGDEHLTSLDEYCKRAGENQKQIYFIGGPDLKSIVKNPNLEIFRKKKLEVLYITDPVDEFVLSNIHQHDGKQLISIDSAEVEFPKADGDGDDGDSGEDKKDDTAKDTTPAGFTKVLNLFRDELGDRVEDVRESTRLTDSVCCLVNPQGSASSQMQKVLSMTSKDFEMSKRILEINPKAPLIERLSGLSANSDHDEFIKSCGCQLFSNALMQEGMLPDVEDSIGRVQEFMQELAQKRSPLIT